MIAYIVGSDMANHRVNVWRHFTNAMDASDWILATYARLVAEVPSRKGLLTYGILRDEEEEKTG